MLIKRGKLYIISTMTSITKPTLQGRTQIDWITCTIDDMLVAISVENVIRLYGIIEHECFKKNLTVQEYYTLAKENSRG